MVTKAKPLRRVWIPKPHTVEKRGLGIPTIEDRGKQALLKLALEPEWEAKFEPNSYGFRPGRSCHDAVEAIFLTIKHKSKSVLDADKVKGTASPDDPSLQDYWHKRSLKIGKQKWAKGSKYEQVAKIQNHQCPVCGNSLYNEEEIETHPIVPVKDCGSDDPENLVHLHKACHKQVHSSKSKKLAGSKA